MRLPLIQRRLSARVRQWLPPVLVLVLTVVLTLAAFPPFTMAEAAFVLLVPGALWAMTSPPWRLYRWVMLAACWLSWFGLIIWLRHIHPPHGWLGLFLLSGIIALFGWVWFLAARRLLPAMLGRAVPVRLLTLLGLGGGWVILEWMRGWVLSGFPWCPLAASQWLRPSLLAVAEWTGYYGVSFILVVFNLGLAAYLYRLRPQRKTLTGDEPRPLSLAGIFRRLCPEFYLGLLLVLGSVWFYLYRAVQANLEPAFRMAVVQPWTPPDLKWDPAAFRNNLEVLEKHTLAIGPLQPDVVLWPEAATPWPIMDSRDTRMREWVEERVREVGAPLLTGNLAALDDRWYNGVFLVTPEEGLSETFYAKRRLVPFGEFVPLPDWVPFVGQVVPLDGEFIPGSEAVLLDVEINQRLWRVGPLVCYEDVFAFLGRDLVRAGADILLVVTNDAWYGEEGGAYQHAAHSVLQAVQTRRPVIRVGNHGWSGWINQYGGIGHDQVLVDDTGSIYFRGVGTFLVKNDPRWDGVQTLYVRWGNWFVGVSAAFAAGTLLVNRRIKKPSL
jgi:apolipoprotein N-acyltransferase